MEPRAALSWVAQQAKVPTKPKVTFFSRPRECRDRVYEQLFVKKLTAERQAQYEKDLSGQSGLTEHEWTMTCERYLLEKGLWIEEPDSFQPMHAGRALLTVNKQLWGE